jgi:hypothetical protein|eukprot:COSAG06_NODE_1809_length_8335_cov_2.741806_2_plen_51_part_00
MCFLCRDVAAARLWGESMGEEFRDKGSNVQVRTLRTPQTFCSQIVTSPLS